MNSNDKILLSHGSGGKLSHDLIKDVFARHFKNDYLSPLSDSAMIELTGNNIAFTTDSYVIKPLKFPGGDIGKLAICGTINDIAVSGAKPEYISCGFIIEEGLEIKRLEEFALSMAKTAHEAGVKIVTGDTKVVEKGAADGLFINTAGIGIKYGGTCLGCNQIKPGDKIIINGNIGDHGMAVMAARERLGLSTVLKSDCAPLHNLIELILNRETNTSENQHVRFMRDPTRGGLATTLCEIAEASGFEIEVDETEIPVSEEVGGIAEVLGIDPLYSANEGKVVCVVSSSSAEQTLNKIKTHPLGKNARIIGEVGESKSGRVNAKTEIGTRRQITMLTGSQLPRIC